MGYINRLPRGLLAYVDTQTQGINPAALTELVQAQLDMEPFYRSLVRYEIVSDLNAAAVGGGYAVTRFVPNDELWLVHAANMEALNASGTDAGNFRFSINAFTAVTGSVNNQIQLAGQIANGSGWTVQAGEDFFSGQTFARPVVLAPGWTVGTYLKGFTGPASLFVTQNLLVNRCRI